MRIIVRLFLLPSLILSPLNASLAQINSDGARASSNGLSLSGLLIVSDSAPRWGLVVGPDLYSVRGDATELRKYERSRVTLTGAIIGRTIVVDSVSLSTIKDEEIRTLVQQLKSYRWEGPQNFTNPTHWIFNFTLPMLQILQAGPAAQSVLLQYLSDTEVKDQIIILLGGVGDESAIEPIIQAMVGPDDHSDTAKRTNLVANLALTNLTQAAVIWHHGGGITVDACPDDPKSCWYTWWMKHLDGFKVSAETENRNYSNYPDYGIYQQP